MMFVVFLFSCVTESELENSLSSSNNTTVEKTESLVTKRIVEKDPVREDATVVQPLVSSKNVSNTKILEKNPVENIKSERKEAVSDTPESNSLTAKNVEESRTVEVPSSSVVQSSTKEKVKIVQTPKKTMRFSKPGPKCVRSIKQVLRRNNGDIRFCYDQQKVKDPSLEGKITLQINVYKKKNSMSVKKDTLKSRGLRTCLQKKIKSWEFEDSCVGTSFRKSYSLIPS